MDVASSSSVPIKPWRLSSTGSEDNGRIPRSDNPKSKNVKIELEVLLLTETGKHRVTKELANLRYGLGDFGHGGGYCFCGPTRSPSSGGAGFAGR